MMYCTTEKIERIWFAPESNEDDLHYVEMYKSEDKCYVTVDGDDDLMWAFKLDDPSNYEVVKFAIMDAMFKACCVDNFKSNLNIAFKSLRSGFILVQDCGVIALHFSNVSRKSSRTECTTGLSRNHAAHSK